MLSLGDLISIFDWIKNSVERTGVDASVSRLQSLRIALRNLHFSERTIESLSRLEKSDVGRIAISQRDNEFDVRMSIKRLLQIENDPGLSITAHRLIDEITSSKAAIRDEIKRTLHRAIRKGDNGDVESLIASIRSLNTAIETLDKQIGGILI
jgi:copper homeostasis protein CutC